MKTNDKNDKNNKLSAKELTLLGLIAEEPIHAYGLEAKIEERHLSEWTEISSSSIYRVLTALQDKGFVETHFEHEGQGATRKVHTLTMDGVEALEKGVISQLGNFASVKDPMLIALAYLPYVSNEDACKQLNTRLAKVIDTQTQLTQMCEDHNVCHVEHQDRPDESKSEEEQRMLRLRLKLLFDHILAHLTAERKFVEEALVFLETSDGKSIETKVNNSEINEEQKRITVVPEPKREVRL